MDPSAQPPESKPTGTRPTLFFVIFGLIVSLLAAFLILHPRPPH
jgi:hypothetical protein